MENSPRNMPEEEEEGIKDDMLSGIQKMDLIRHNNQLVERVHFLEK